VPNFATGLVTPTTMETIPEATLEAEYSIVPINKGEELKISIISPKI
jgi:hypothetical protein